MAQAAPFAAIAFHNLAEEEAFGSPFGSSEHFPFWEELAAYKKVYEAYEPAAVRDRNESGDRRSPSRDREAGYHQVTHHTMPGRENEMPERWADLIEMV